MKEKESKKHHYIPRFYLKGFTDTQNKFYVFDKETQKIWVSNPDNSFLENRRNTGKLEHQVTGEVTSSDLAEKALDHFDGRSSLALEEIRNSTKNDDMLTTERLYVLRFFIVSTFWRVPANDPLKSEIMRTHSFQDLGFGMFNTATGRRDIETEKILNSTDLWQKMSPAYLSVTTFLDKFDRFNIDDWRLYYRGTNFHIVTDNPIILEKYESFYELHQELFCPLCSNVLMVSTKGTKPTTLPPIFSVKLDILLFHNAHRYVACSNKDYLEFLAKEVFTTLKLPSIVELLKKDIYKTFPKDSTQI